MAQDCGLKPPEIRLTTAVQTAWRAADSFCQAGTSFGSPRPARSPRGCGTATRIPPRGLAPFARPRCLRGSAEPVWRPPALSRHVPQGGARRSRRRRRFFGTRGLYLTRRVTFP
jgi:hypothetical protein